jgi:curved DNA-binding protein CbpA
MSTNDPAFDPYKVLQVDPEAEDEVLEAAYRRLARKYHPDVAPGAEAQARMVALNRAWEMVSDPTRRARVDRARAATVQRSGGPAPTHAPAGPEPSWHARPPGGSAPEPTARPRRADDPATGGGSGTSTRGGARSSESEPEPTWPGRTAGSGFDAFADTVRPEARPQEPDRVSRDWTTGRSGQGGGYEPAMRAPDGRGAAGPPPGRPSGSILRFGRYDGWSLGEIARTDLEYLEWLERMPIGRAYTDEIDAILRRAGRRRSVQAEQRDRRGLFRRR